MCLDSFRFDIPEITEAWHCVHFGVSTSLKARNPMLEDFGWESLKLVAGLQLSLAMRMT